MTRTTQRMRWRKDGGRVTDPPPEFPCRGRCGGRVFRRHSLCADCWTLRATDRDAFRAALAKREVF